MAGEGRNRRTWGYWTQAKLQILARYLQAFATASKGVSERVYLDAFAGEGLGIDRLTGEEQGAASGGAVVVDVDDRDAGHAQFVDGALTRLDDGRAGEEATRPRDDRGVALFTRLPLGHRPYSTAASGE